MGYSLIGSSQDGYVKTPTLTQVIRDGVSIPSVSVVQLVFKPSTGGCYSFVTEFPYRVNVYPKTELFQLLSDSLDDMRMEETSLFIRVPDVEVPKFELVSDDRFRAGWEIQDWGYRLALIDKPKAKAKATRSTPRKVADTNP